MGDLIGWLIILFFILAYLFLLNDAGDGWEMMNKTIKLFLIYKKFI